MIFRVQDVEQFQIQKQFIDTAVVPLLSLEFTEDRMKQSSSANEYLMNLTSFVEQQFRGRLMLMPPFSYTTATKSENLPFLVEKELKAAGFKSVLFFTCDPFWHDKKEELTVIWMPPIPLESMDTTMKQRILEDQLKQIVPVLTSVWV